MSDIPRCGFFGLFTSFMRRVMCVGTRRGSNESCYHELDDQDAVPQRFEDVVESSDSTPSIFDDIRIDDEKKTFQEVVIEITADGVADVWLNGKKPIGSFHSIRKKRRKITMSSVRKELTILDDCYPLKVQMILAKSTTWNFDTHDLDKATGGRCLPVLCMHLFSGYGLIDFFRLLPDKCWKLFKIIEDNYHASNIYHNSVHAADVTQAIHCFLQQPRLLNCMNRLEILVALLAAITHDLDHPGVNHAFLVATKHPLAIMFKDKELGNNDRTPLPRRGRRGRRLQEMLLELAATRADFSELESSPKMPPAMAGTSAAPKKNKMKRETPPVESILEHHHWRAAYSCILESGIFSHMQERLPEIKRMLKSLILATDITQQNLYLNVFKDHLARKSLDMNRADHRHIVLQMALKAADISNPGRPWAISHKWSQKVCSEFYAQGDRERKLNLKISYLCDRENDTVPKIQTGFFRYVVMPLYTEWHHYLGSDVSRSMLKNLIHNEAEWARADQRSALSKSVTQSSDVPGLSDADMVENELETSTNLSGSSEMLIQSSLGSGGFASVTRVSRRSSHSPIQQSSLKDALRRYSAPLQMFSEPRPRSRARSAISEVRLREDLHGVSQNAINFTKDAKARHVSMLDIVMAVTKNKSLDQAGSEKNTVTPPVSEAAPSQELIDFSSPRRLVGVEYTIQGDSDSEEETSSDKKVGKKIGSVIIEESSMSSGSQLTPAGQNGANHFLVPSLTYHTSSAPSSEGRLDRQLEENPCAAKTVASSCEMLKYTPAKDGTDEITDVLLPQLSISDMYQRRRGSAPAPIAVSDLQRLASSLSLQLGIRRQSASCQQRVAVEAAPVSGFARRGSLPVEVMTGSWIST